MIHAYQQWEGSRIHEGMTELFALMLSHQLQAAHVAQAAQYELTLNPTYMQVTQLVIDELLPRMGLGALAALYFAGTMGGLESVLMTGRSTGVFYDACARGIAAYDFAEAIQMLIPMPRRPPMSTTPAGATVLLGQALGDFDAYLGANDRLGVGVGERALCAKVIRVDAKSAAFQGAVDRALLYRPQVTDTARVHRLDAWLDETRLQILQIRDELP